MIVTLCSIKAHCTTYKYVYKQCLLVNKVISTCSIIPKISFSLSRFSCNEPLYTPFSHHEPPYSKAYLPFKPCMSKHPHYDFTHSQSDGLVSVCCY